MFLCENCGTTRTMVVNNLDDGRIQVRCINCGKMFFVDPSILDAPDQDDIDDGVDEIDKRFPPNIVDDIRKALQLIDEIDELISRRDQGDIGQDEFDDARRGIIHQIKSDPFFNPGAPPPDHPNCRCYTAFQKIPIETDESPPGKKSLPEWLTKFFADMERELSAGDRGKRDG